MKTLKDLFLDEVGDMYDAERRIVKALPKLVKAATCEKLKTALQAHLKETEGHVTKLEQVFKSMDQKAKGQTCKTTVALLEEGGDIVTEFKGSPALTAALISAAQKVEHHEIASYAHCTNGLNFWETAMPPTSWKKFLARRRPPTQPSLSSR